MQFLPYSGTGFTGPIQSLNLSTVSYPGSVRTRFSQRKPQSYMYATFAPVSTTTHCKATSWVAISGTCAPADTACKIPAQNKHRVPLPTLWKWVCLTRRVLRIGFRRLLTGSYSRSSGDPTRLPFAGLTTWIRFVQLRVPLQQMIPTPFISACQIDSVPTGSTMASGWQYPPMKLRRGQPFHFQI